MVAAFGVARSRARYSHGHTGSAAGRRPGMFVFALAGVFSGCRGHGVGMPEECDGMRTGMHLD
jgi:hypothetical protein